MLPLRADLRLVARQLRRSPAVTVAAILSLALGIGLNVAVFSLINGLFLKPLPGLRDVERIEVLSGRKGEDRRSLPISYPDFLDYRARSTCFESLAAFQAFGIALSGESQAENLVAEMVSSDFFQVAGLRPALGRFFLAEEGTFPDGRAVAAISYGLWQRRFAGDARILGRIVRLDGQSFTVVGVLPQGFRGLHALATTDVWVPLAAYRSVFPLAALVEQRSGQVLSVVGRLRPGSRHQAAAAEMRSVAAALAREYPNAGRDRTVTITPLAEAARPANFLPASVGAATVLLVAAGLLLLMTCTNVGLLLWARGAARSREIALRLSLGARRHQVVRLFLVESGILAVLASAVSLVTAVWGRSLLWGLRPPYLDRDAFDASLDWRVLAFIAAITLLTSFLCGLPPCLLISEGDLAARLASEPGQLSSAGRRHLAGEALVGLQVALCFLALASAALFLDSLRSALRVNPGFDSASLLAVSFALPAGAYDERQGRDFEQRLVERVAALPGVKGASLAENGLLSGFREWRGAYLDTAPAGGALIGSTVVDSQYFTATGIPIVRGRAFNGGDRPGSGPVVIVNQSLAARYWPGQNALGKRFRLDDEAAPVEIVGVAADSVYLTLGEGPTPFLYLPLGQRYVGTATLHVRAAGSPAGLVAQVRRELHAMNPDLPVTVRTLEEALGSALWLPRTAAELISLFALAGFGLAAVGIYGLAAHGAQRRSREIGIRIALGARRAVIARLLTSSTLGAVGGGLALGLALVFPLGRWLSRFLYDAAPKGAAMLAAAAVLAVAATVASLIPALRATTTRNWLPSRTNLPPRKKGGGSTFFISASGRALSENNPTEGGFKP
jgi:predicted permease